MPESRNCGSALLLIDLQNSFFHPQGGNYYAESEDVLPAVNQLIDAARRLERPIVFVAERHRPNVDDFEANKLPEHCVDGQFDSELIEGMFPRGEREFLLTKRRMSAFNATDLDLLLRELGVNRLIIGGVKANVCIRATVQDAFSLGYKCYVAKEAVNSNRNNLAEASLEDIDRYMGWVVPTLKAIELLS